MKKIPVILGVAGLLIAGAYLYLSRPAQPAFQPEEGYALLYDGESLDGWRVVGGGATYAAEGESIVGRHGPGENTFLRTERSFGDFNLRLQVRWDEPGNSGVMFRAGQRGGDGRTFGYQYELDPSERSWTGGIYDEARRGWLASLEDDPAAREAVRLDGWNDVEIEARGASLKTWINGVPAADIVDGLSAEGFIALQVHAGGQGVIRWRHIRIRELPAALSAGASLLQASAWRSLADVPVAFDAAGLSGPLPPEGGWLQTRRKFTDAMVRMTVPACESPTRVQLRYRVDETGDVTSFAEVAVYRDRAEGRLVEASGVTEFEPVKLAAAQAHALVGLSRGNYVVLTVGEKDALRVPRANLYERGELRIQPARCGDDFRIDGLRWYSLKDQPAGPQFYQTLDTAPALPLAPDEARAAFRIAPGFEIELVAAEPLVEDPVAMAWDEYGRLYVVEMRGYMPDAYGVGSEEPVGQVVRLTDANGDGRMDSSEVFLGGLVNPRAVAVVNEGILIGEPPDLWLCVLPQPEALCADQRRVGGYATDVTAANVEHMENGLRQGLDNWLYNAKSDRRLRLVDGGLVAEHGLQRGQWGISKDNYGRLLYNHNSTWIQADLFPAEDLLVPGAGGRAAGLGVGLTQPSPVYSVRVNPGVNRAYLKNTLREDGRLKNATGVSGLVVYRGDQFPPQYAGDVFVPEVAGNVVAQFDMADDGLEITATQRLYEDPDWGQRDFLGSSDERFRPVDAMNGPDGALYIIDMYRGIIQDDHFLTDELREQIFQRQLDTPIGLGRIWRVRHSGREPAPPPRLAGANDAELLAALAHGNGWVRDTAQRLLLGREGALGEPLAALAVGAETVPALHALWTLQGRGELTREIVLQLAGSGDPRRQEHALRAGRELLTTQDVLALAAGLDGASPVVTRQLALVMGDHAAAPGVRGALVAMLAAGADSVYLRQAVERAVHGRELPFLRELFAAGALSAPVDAHKDALQVLAQNAYRSGRGDLASTAPADPQLLQLLALAASRDGEFAWQQIALLEGIARVTGDEGFVPAALPAPPPLFADTSISGEDPLWAARLSGRAAFTWPGDELALGIVPLSPAQMRLMELGKAFYVQCAACHGDAGQGIENLAPPLAGASWVTGPPEWLGRIILQGLSGPVEVKGEVFDGVMPAHGHLAELTDDTLAGLMTYMRRSWGNRADPVSAEQAAAIRAASAGRNTPWTVEELQAVPVERGYGRYEGKYSVSFVTMTITEKVDGLHMSVPLYGAGVLEETGEGEFRGSAGGEQVKLKFVEAPDGSIDRFILYRNGEEIPVKRDD